MDVDVCILFMLEAEAAAAAAADFLGLLIRIMHTERINEHRTACQH